MVKTRGRIGKSIKKYFGVPKVEGLVKHRNVKKKKNTSIKPPKNDGINGNQTLSSAEIDGRSDGICISASMEHHQNVCNNGNQTSASAEIVGRSDDLMSLVIRMLPNHRDRYNLKATCKRFYNLCNERRNFRPFLKLMDRQIMDTSSTRYRGAFTFGQNIKFLQNTLIISVPFHIGGPSEYLENYSRMILLNNFHIRKLEIESIDPRYIAHFRHLNCFEFVESVTFDINNSLLVGKTIFDNWKNLNPKTIKFTRLHPARYYIQDNFSDNGLLKLFPYSVENIQLDCACNEISWLFNLTDFFPKRRFDTLEFGNKFLSGIDGVWNFGDKFVKLIKRFKHVKITLKDKLSHGITGYFFRNMILIWQLKDTEIEFDVKLSLKKLADDQDRLFIPEREQAPEGFAGEIFKSIFLKMKCLSVTCERNWIKPSIRFRGLFAKLVEKMTNLKTLEVSMKIFSGLKEFYFFINRLSIGIKNLKFVNCGRLNNYSMQLLSTSCPNIENLSIEGVKWGNISIKKMTHLFKNLKCLSILFLHDERNISLFRKLVGATGENGLKVTTWPELDFLQIIFNSPTARERSEVGKIERNTPRKTGVFFVNYYPETHGSSSNVLEVVFQKRAEYYSEFMNIFK